MLTFSLHTEKKKKGLLLDRQGHVDGALSVQGAELGPEPKGLRSSVQIELSKKNVLMSRSCPNKFIQKKKKRKIRICNGVESTSQYLQTNVRHVEIALVFIYIYIFLIVFVFLYKV